MAERRGNQPHPRQFEAFISPDMDRAMSQLPPIDLAYVPPDANLAYSMTEPGTAHIPVSGSPPPGSTTDNPSVLNPRPSLPLLTKAEEARAPRSIDLHAALRNRPGDLFPASAQHLPRPPPPQLLPLPPPSNPSPHDIEIKNALELYVARIKRPGSICSASTGDSTDDTTRSSGSGSSSRSLGN